MPSPDRRHDLIEAGTQLFLTTGYTATSIDAICQAAAVTKGAFFHHFKSKNDFASEVLVHTWEPVVTAHEGGSDHSSPREALAEHIRFMVDWICDAGRLMPMLAQELGSSNPEIGHQVRGYFETWMHHLTTRLEAAWPNAATSAELESLKDFVVATTEGVPTARAQFGDQVVDNVSQHLVRSVIAAIDGSPS